MHFPRAINDRPYDLNLKLLDKSEFEGQINDISHKK